MKKLFSTIGLITYVALQTSIASAADTSSIDSKGYIREWVMLAPVPLPDRGSAGGLLLREQVKDEASLKPKAGDTIKINNKELTWRKITAPANYFDFNIILDSLNDRAAGYMATYIECEQDMPDVMISVGSNDQGRIYFNGVDIYAVTAARPLEIDADKGKITLKKGLNVIIFKIINESNSWQGSMRLTDMAGVPLKGIKVKLSP
jgi:hypothetical protein